MVSRGAVRPPSDATACSLDQPLLHRFQWLNWQVLQSPLCPKSFETSMLYIALSVRPHKQQSIGNSHVTHTCALPSVFQGQKSKVKVKYHQNLNILTICHNAYSYQVMPSSDQQFSRFLRGQTDTQNRRR